MGTWSEFFDDVFGEGGAVPEYGGGGYESGAGSAALGEAAARAMFGIKSSRQVVREKGVDVSLLSSIENIFGYGAPASDFQPGDFPVGDVYSRPHRRRSINPMNVRAARRAVHRLQGATRLLHSITSMLPRRPERKLHFPHRRRHHHFGRRR